MAKVLGLHGKARGKVGSVVYRTEAGIGTIASEYNPNPRNPRTLAQVEQRSKMNLAGRLSKIIPYEDISALASSRRKARQVFMSNLLLAITRTTNAGATLGGGSKIEWGKLKFSNGPIHPVDATANIVEGTAKLNASVTFSADDTKLQGVHFIVIFGDYNEWLGVRSFDISRNAMAPVEVDFADFVDDPSSLAVVVYALPILVTDEVSGAIYRSMLEGTDISVFSVQWLRSLAERNAVGATQYLLSVRPE